MLWQSNEKGQLILSLHMSEFIASFKVVGLGTVEIFLLGFCGFFVLRQGILAECCLKTLSTLIINVTLPCLIFTSVITKFNIRDYPDWWIYPLVSVSLITLACGLGFVVSKMDTTLQEKKEFISLMGFQNVSFLPLPLVAAMFPKPEAEKYFIYIFLFLLGFIPLLTSVGVLLTSGKTFTKSTLKNALNPPFYTILGSLILASLGIKKYIPSIVLNPVKLLGGCTIPLAMIVLGGVIYVNFRNKVHLNNKVIFELVVTKLILLPVIVFFLINIFGLHKELSFLLILQAAMPPAGSLVAIAKNYDGNYEFIGQSTFFLYVFSLITIPLCIGLYMYFIY